PAAQALLRRPGRGRSGPPAVGGVGAAVRAGPRAGWLDRGGPCPPSAAGHPHTPPGPERPAGLSGLDPGRRPSPAHRHLELAAPPGRGRRPGLACPRGWGPALWPWPPTSAPFPILRCTSCWSGCPGIGSTSYWMLPSRLRGRPHDRQQALPALRPGPGRRGLLPAPGAATVVLLPALHPGGLPREATPPAPGPGHRGPAAGGGSGPPAPPR